MSFLTRFAPHVARVVMGLIFFVFGLNYFFNFLPPMPPPEGQAAQTFFMGLMASGFVMPIIKVIEIAAGIALLSNRFVPLALILLAPIVVVIAGFHFVLAPAYPMPIALIAMGLYLAWTHRAAFAPLFRAHTTSPAAATRESLPAHAAPAR
ncbi:DoxX family membrane protein [Pyxidicoccus xibeiensis]|uniref:DoxX family membrane protein n=1 Tax=Pyxidicoccus xibeiensis TaxID=2906759 RepID=UPI0020A70EB9|nr:DoxX family membrane protein [Pyxidicoccus xibeiensis]MCP3142299.1 DoxX family membrane protein [Pyxidicoccus xibeiensis]